MDPCEKEPTDVLDNMVPQDREEITVNAQVTAPFVWTERETDAQQPGTGKAGVCSMRIINNRKQEQLQAHLLGVSLYFSKNVSSSM